MRLSIALEGFECYVSKQGCRYTGSVRTNNGDVKFSAHTLAEFVDAFQETVDEYVLWLEHAAEVQYA